MPSFADSVIPAEAQLSRCEVSGIEARLIR
jgi:hypothetical protein